MRSDALKFFLKRREYEHDDVAVCVVCFCEVGL